MVKKGLIPNIELRKGTPTELSNLLLKGIPYALRVMIKSPGDPDEVTTAVVKGSYVGSIYRTPLHLFAR